MAPSTSSPPFPAEGVYYRIQSVDFATYLELYDVNDETIVTRPMKDCLEQQWTFVAGTGRGAYKIHNAATQFLRNPRYLSFTLDEASQDDNKKFSNGLAVTEEDNPRTWTIKETDEQYVCSITCKGNKRNQEIFFMIEENGKTGFIEAKSSNDSTFAQNKKWKILEVSSSVSKDKYRIRTLNGAALQMQPKTGVVSLQTLTKGKHQEWDVEPLGNGKCTIKSVSEGAFLGWEATKEGFAKVAKTALPLVWNIDSLGEYTYSVSMKFTLPDQSSIVLALTCGNNNEIILKVKKVAHNRIWLFEAVDVNTDDSSLPNAATSDPYPEIPARAYRLRNVGTSQHIYWNSAFYPNSSSNPLNLRYPASGCEITLDYGGHYCDRAGDLVVSSGSPTNNRWILERDAAPGGGYCYFICAANDPTNVLSGDTRVALGYNMFTVVPKRPGYTRQQWMFDYA